MVTRHVGGEVVKGGIYWSTGAGEFVAVPQEGGKLSGGSGDRYLRAPLPLVLVAGPLMGLAFAIFLPLSGLLVLVPFLAAKMREAISPARVGAAHMAGARLQPGVSYLEPGSRGATEQGSAPEGEQDGKLVDMAQEIAERRWQQK